jgi:hypothetical protein
MLRPPEAPAKPEAQRYGIALIRAAERQLIDKLGTVILFSRFLFRTSDGLLWAMIPRNGRCESRHGLRLSCPSTN